MSKPKVFEKPSGVMDYLPETVGKLRRLQQDVLACMQRWGYREVITPTLEYYDTVGVASSTADSKLFKLLDKRGVTMVLRPDVTAPIARISASLLQDSPLPLRFSYHANVFRAIEEEAGRQAEFFQTGVELIGDPSPDADAEIVALACDVLVAAGIGRFKLAIGHVGFIDGLLQGLLPDHVALQAELKGFLARRDYVGYRQLVRRSALTDEVQNKLLDLLRLKGDRKVCEQALLISSVAKAHEAITHLSGIWESLEAHGVSQYVTLDLTMVGDVTYYSGMTFEAYADGLGFPVCSGGRYDDLVGQFGRPVAATGFAMKTNRVLEIVGDTLSVEAPSLLIVYQAEQRAEALALGRRMRAEREGWMIETRIVDQAYEAVEAVEQLSDAGKYTEIVHFTKEPSA